MTIPIESMNTLRDRRNKIIHNIAPDKLEKLHARGSLSARERVNALFVEGSFQELGMHAHHNAVSFGMAGRELPTDGVITGTGYVGQHAGSGIQPGLSRCWLAPWARCRREKLCG
jgi:acetyl-CoA carboxylase carboxyltransferase component